MLRILFLYGNSIDPEKGGIQRVTTDLANFFESKGHKTFYVSRMINGVLYEHDRQYYLPDSKNLENKINYEFIKTFMYTNSIDVVINQSGMDSHISRLAYSVKKDDVSLISCIHNSLLSQVNHFDTTYENNAKKMGLKWLLPLTKKKVIKDIILALYKLKYKRHYKALCINSDKVVLLSKSFEEDLIFFLPKNLSNFKSIAIPNPSPYLLKGNETYLKHKKKQVLYVGRLDFRQKRVDLLLKIWEKVYRNNPQWELKVIGGGSDLKKLQQVTAERGLQRVYFEGFQDPTPYYKESSIFCMTSAYEGFGIVLVEAMTFGVVPLAFNSYSSAADIITNTKDGSLIPAFDLNKYAKELDHLMNNTSLRLERATSCVKKSKLFTLDSIGPTWLELMTNL